MNLYTLIDVSNRESIEVVGVLVDEETARKTASQYGFEVHVVNNKFPGHTIDLEIYCPNCDRELCQRYS